MTDAGLLLGAVRDGWRLALEFNPLASALGAVAAGLVAGFRGAGRPHAVLAAAVVLGGWLVGDGSAVMGALGVSTAPSQTGPVLTLAVWAIGGLVLGYVVPAAAGVFVGRRVFFGTGRLAAASVGLGTSLAIAVLARVIA
ncbi:MAG: hypothetical protein QMC94_01435 [Anaerosomatales bacterium]|nr:hypothetical protein [Anaerosomatales bacterium]